MELTRQIVENWWHIPVLMGLILVYGFLLNRLLFRPVSRVLDERRQAVREASGLSARSKDELQSRFAQYEQAILEARRKASGVKEAARHEAYAYRTALLDQVRA